LTIVGELEYLEGLRSWLGPGRKDEEAQQVAQVATTLVLLTIKQICVNKNRKGKTLHLTIEVQNGLIEGLVDIGASMLIIAIGVVQELSITHLVSRTKSFKMVSSTITKPL
jgi:hypothetical protein